LDEAADFVVGVPPLVEQGRPEPEALGGERGAVGLDGVERIRLVHEPGDAHSHGGPLPSNGDGDYANRYAPFRLQHEWFRPPPAGGCDQRPGRTGLPERRPHPGSSRPKPFRPRTPQTDCRSPRLAPTVGTSLRDRDRGAVPPRPQAEALPDLGGSYRVHRAPD